jgi:hypothetical protein
VIRLEADDPDVRALTVKALADTASRTPGLTIRCANCGAELAQAGKTKFGPLFTSTWTVDDGTIAGARPVDRVAEIVEQSGPPPIEGHGVIALLALPPKLPPDHPDLLVRCRDDGDALLDRQTVLEWMIRQKRRTTIVDVAFPRSTYRRPDPDFALQLATNNTSHVVCRIGGTSTTP